MHNKLREIRARHRVTQQELAERAGVTRQTIHAVENSKMIPSIKIGLKIAAALGYSVEEIFKLKEEKGVVVVSKASEHGRAYR
ncbi:MAG: helix-turn-helix transcriptional regulator [archaeon]